MGPGGQSAGWGAAPCLWSHRARESSRRSLQWSLHSPISAPRWSSHLQPSRVIHVISLHLLAITTCESRPLMQLQILATKNSKLQVILISGKGFCHEGKACGSCRAAGFLPTIYPSRLRSEIFQSTSAIKYSGKKELLTTVATYRTHKGIETEQAAHPIWQQWDSNLGLQQQSRLQ